MSCSTFPQVSLGVLIILLLRVNVVFLRVEKPEIWADRVNDNEEFVRAQYKLNESPYLSLFYMQRKFWCHGGLIGPTQMITTPSCFDEGINFRNENGMLWLTEGFDTPIIAAFGDAHNKKYYLEGGYCVEGLDTRYNGYPQDRGILFIEMHQEVWEKETENPYSGEKYYWIKYLKPPKKPLELGDQVSVYSRFEVTWDSRFDPAWGLPPPNGVNYLEKITLMRAEMIEIEECDLYYQKKGIKKMWTNTERCFRGFVEDDLGVRVSNVCDHDQGAPIVTKIENGTFELHGLVKNPVCHYCGDCDLFVGEIAYGVIEFGEDKKGWYVGEGSVPISLGVEEEEEESTNTLGGSVILLVIVLGNLVVTLFLIVVVVGLVFRTKIKKMISKEPTTPKKMKMKDEPKEQVVDEETTEISETETDSSSQDYSSESSSDV